jgi:N-acetylglucosamine transport system substrate-binding protein
MKDVLEGLPDFEMTVRPTPSLTSEDVLPMSAVISSASADYIVFANGVNVQGGKEYLRLLFSQEGSRLFSELTHAATVVKGSTDGLDLGPAYGSVRETIDAAGENTWVSKYGAWYKDLSEEAEVTMGGIMTGEMTVDEMIERMQAMTDQVREDDSIPKYTREAPGAAASPAS